MCGYKNLSSSIDSDNLWERVSSSLQSRPNLDHTTGILRQGKHKIPSTILFEMSTSVYLTTLGNEKLAGGNQCFGD